VYHRNAELRIRRQREEHPDEPMVEEQAVIRRDARTAVRTVRAVHRRKQGIPSPGLRKSKLRSRCAEAHRLACEVAGRARAPVGAEALKEGTLLVHRPVDVQGADDAGGIEEKLRILRPSIARLGSSSRAEQHARHGEGHD
jgi:hypothetical protein